MIQILRPVNCLLTLASVLLGGWLVVRSLPMALLAAGVSAAAIAGAGNTLNDVVDIRRDRVNRPDRPLPSDRLSTRSAVFLAAALFAFGLALAVRLPLPAVALAAGAVVGLVVYNLWAKDVPVVGNLLISLLGAAAFLYGAATAGSLWPAGITAGFAGLYHFGREILKDVADQAGDRRVGGDNVPLRWGLRPALIGATVLYSLLVVATPVPYLIGIYSWPYLALVLLLDALLLGLLFQLWSDPDPGRFARVSRLLKVGMPLGLAAILLGAL